MHACINACEIIKFIQRRAWLINLKLEDEAIDSQNVAPNSRFILICHMTMVEQNYMRFLKYELPGTEFWPIIPITIWRQTFF